MKGQGEDLDRQDYPYCFGCGRDNPAGLRLELRLEDGTLRAEFTPQDVHQGWPGLLHGGIISSLLYEVMENVTYYNGIRAVGRHMETRFMRPGKLGKRLLLEASIIRQTGVEIDIGGTLTDEDGTLVAEGKITMVALMEDQMRRLGMAPGQSPGESGGNL